METFKHGSVRGLRVKLPLAYSAAEFKRICRRDGKLKV
jgi:hypothetical protein